MKEIQKKNSFLRKKIISIVICIALTVLPTISIQAANLGTLSYWYSDSDTIGRWDESSINVNTNRLNSNNTFYFLVAMVHALGQWSTPTGITLTKTTTTGPIVYYGGTKAEIDTLGLFTLPASATGATGTTNTTEGTWTYGSTTKTGLKTTYAYGCIVDNGRTADEYKKTATHELGHALGWKGHSSTTTDVMYSQPSSVTTLTSRDKNHLSQVY